MLALSRARKWPRGGRFKLAVGIAAVENLARRDQPQGSEMRARKGPVGGCFDHAQGDAADATLAQRDQLQCEHKRVRDRHPVGGCFE